MGTAVAALLAVTLLSCGVAPLVPEAPASSDEAAASQVRPPDLPADAVAVALDRVVDGDTVRLRPAPGSGLGMGDSVRVRLLNIDAPELPRDDRPGECLAVEATERLAALLAGDERVWVAADREDRDPYDRPLRGLWNADGVFVAEVLAAEGLAVAVLFPPNDRFHDRVASAAERAAAAGLGVHGPACR